VTLARVGLALVVALALAAPVRAADRVRLTAAGYFADYAMYFLAIDRLYFKDEGLDPEILMAGGGAATPALISGDVQLSTSASVAITAILKGAALKLVFTGADRTPYQLWTSLPNIRAVADLKDKQIGIESRGDTHELAVRQVLSAAGIDQAGVALTPMGSRSAIVAAVQSGAVAAASVTTDEAERLKLLPNLRMIVDMEATVHTIVGGAAVSDRLLSENRPLVKRMLRAIVKGRRAMEAFPEEAVAALMKRDPAAQHDPLLAAYHQAIARKTKDGTIPIAAQRTEIEIRSALIGISKDRMPTPDKVFDFSLIDEINRDLDGAHWAP